MSKLLPILSLVVFISGCGGVSPSPYRLDSAQQGCRCPEFTRRLSIEVKDYNSTYGLISWKDAAKIESFLRAKKSFNKSIQSMNEGRTP